MLYVHFDKVEENIGFLNKSSRFNFRCTKRFPLKKNKVNPIETEERYTVKKEKIEMDNVSWTEQLRKG